LSLHGLCVHCLDAGIRACNRHLWVAVLSFGIFGYCGKQYIDQWTTTSSLLVFENITFKFL